MLGGTRGALSRSRSASLRTRSAGRLTFVVPSGSELLAFLARWRRTAHTGAWGQASAPRNPEEVYILLCWVDRRRCSSLKHCLLYTSPSPRD
eukprot:4795793-Alexandrium_andersonii.AAC.1